MKHVIISDTHAPFCIDKIYAHVKKRILDEHYIDAIVINGDLLGTFSMRSSTLHKSESATTEQKFAYLRQGAPQFTEKYRKTGRLTKRLLKEYVAERYEWCYSVIERFAKLHRTIFNLGNHESALHFLVFQELQYLLGIDTHAVGEIEQEFLQSVYDEFEEKLYALEKTHAFHYIRENYVLDGRTLIMGIPGESHATVGGSRESQVQEARTRHIVGKVRPLLDKIDSIIIYNHTQGEYDDETGRFHSASPSLQSFMASLPKNVVTRIYVQSHNHWSFTQFLYDHDFHFILNNAGLHDGIYNLVSFDWFHVAVWDVNPNTDRIIKLKGAAKEFAPEGDLGLVERNYPNFLDVYVERKTNLSQLDSNRMHLR